MNKTLTILLVFLTGCGSNNPNNKEKITPNASAEIMVAPTGSIFQNGAQEAYKQTKESLKSIIKSDDVIEETLERLNLTPSQENVSECHQNLTFDTVDNNQLIQIFYYHKSPKQATQFLDTLLWVLEEYYIKSKTAEAERTLYYIQNQIDSITVKIDTLQEHMKSFQAMNVPTTFEVGLLMSDYSSMTQHLSESELILSDLNNLKEVLSTGGSIPASFYGYNSVLADMIEEYKNRVIGNEPQKDIDHIKHMIISYIDREIEVINTQISSIKDKLPLYKEKLNMLPNELREMQEIQEQLNVQEQMYILLLEKKAETEIERQAMYRPFMVIREPFEYH